MWGCPAILAEMTVKIGGLGMLAIGLCYLAAVRQGASPSISGHERIAVALCAYGLIASARKKLVNLSLAARALNAS